MRVKGERRSGIVAWSFNPMGKLRKAGLSLYDQPGLYSEFQSKLVLQTEPLYGGCSMRVGQFSERMTYPRICL